MSVIFSTVLVKTENVEDVLQVPNEMHLYFCLFHSVNTSFRITEALHHVVNEACESV